MKKGIKVLGMNMTAIKGDGMIYEMNKEYIHDGDIECRRSGYHYFENLAYALTLYNISQCRVFECELNGDIFDHTNDIHCTNKIKLVRELSKEEIRKHIESYVDTIDINKYSRLNMCIAKQGFSQDKFIRCEIPMIRQILAHNRYGLDKLVNDKDEHVRIEVAKHGYGLDKLVNDEDWRIRLEVAKHGYGLDKLINDKDWAVRKEVARQGYGLDILVNDEDEDVRAEVAKQGQYLDILINDIDCYVRREVVRQGYGLDILVNDKDCDVRAEVARMQLELLQQKANL